MKNKFNFWQLLAGIFGMTGVMLGAYASHGVTDPAIAVILERAANYQILHALALAFTSLITGRLALISRLAFTSGIVLFSGSLGAKYVLHWDEFARFAPTGGILLMAGWFALGVSSMAKYQTRVN